MRFNDTIYTYRLHFETESYHTASLRTQAIDLLFRKQCTPPYQCDSDMAYDNSERFHILGKTSS